MTHETEGPSFIVETERDDLASVGEFEIGQATVEAVQYGSDFEHLTRLGVNDAERDSLYALNPNSDHIFTARGDKALPSEEILLKKLALWGKAEGVAMSEVFAARNLIDTAELFSSGLDRLPGLEDLAVAIRALTVTARIEAFIEASKQAHLEAVNAYLAQQRSRGAALYVVTETLRRPATSEHSASYAKTKLLAELEAIDFAEDGALLSILRQADGRLGYVSGSTTLYW